jgi:putative PIN family toxin of toxin-antitoxin system
MGAEKEEEMKLVVLDTNVLVSALVLRGHLAEFVELWKKGVISPAISRETFAEFKKVLGYPKFCLSDNDIKAIIEQEILPYFEVVDIKEEIHGVCRDPNDDIFVSAAVNAKVSHIITGDKDLLELAKYRSIKILSPQEYLALLKK